jgi:DNA polymerase-3 subunit gamma/tau
MLGLADRARIVDLFESVMKGDIATALAELQAQHDTGADPLVVLTDLAEFTHYVARLKLAPDAASHAAVSETERVRGTVFAEQLSLSVLSRAWQMLAKGIAEAADAPRPLIAADMVLVRLCHAAELPTPDEALRALKEPGDPPSTGVSQQRPQASAVNSRQASVSGTPQAALRHPASPRLQSQQEPQSAAATHPELRRFEDLVARAHAERDRMLVYELERHVRPVRFERGRLEIALEGAASPDLPQRLSQVLQGWTGKRWIVAVSQEKEAETVHEMRRRNKAAVMDEVRADPLVRKVLDRFPGAEIVSVRERSTETADGTASEEADDLSRREPQDSGEE